MFGAGTMIRMPRYRVLALWVLASACAAMAAGQTASLPVTPGEPFPPTPLKVLRPGAAAPEPLDLAGLLGKRPIVLLQFAVGASAGEGLLLGLQDLAASGLSGDIAIMGTIRASSPDDLARAQARLAALGVTLPIAVQEGPALGILLGGTKMGISLIDHRGILRIVRASGLRQSVGAGSDMVTAIRDAAARKPVPTVERLEFYEPAQDLIGERIPDFTLKPLGGGEAKTLSALAGKAQRVTALLFWHPDSQESFTIMSGVVAGAASYQKWIDVVSVADLGSEAEAARASEFVRRNKMSFPVLRDEQGMTHARYRVGSPPTMFFIRPDGTIDSVYSGANVNYVPVFSVRIRRILKVGKEYEGSASSP